MRKRLAFLLAAAMLLAGVLAGCGGKGSLTGTWRGTIDITESMNAEMGKADGMEFSDSAFEGLTFDLMLTMNEDNTFSMAADRESVKVCADKMKEQFKTVILDTLEKQLKKEGTGLSVEKALAAAGMNIEDIIESAGFDSSMDKVAAALTQEGSYRNEDGNLYFSEEPCPYQIEKGVLTIEAAESAAGEAYVQTIFPLVMEKAE